MTKRKIQPYRSSPPAGATCLRTYGELERYLAAFAAGYMNLVILVGSQGLAKSRTVRASLGESVCWIEGNATAFGMYVALYRNRDRLVVIDDVDSLYADRNGVRLLKCLCQTEPQKTVGWHSATKGLEKAGIPREFQTSSRVIIICNEWKTSNPNVAALQDRGHVLAFCPTPEEVHRTVARWYPDEEILAWFSGNLRRLPQLSLRMYLRALELKRAGIDWTCVATLAPEDERRRLVQELHADQAYLTQESRVRAFVARGVGCRATYFNHLRRIRAGC